MISSKELALRHMDILFGGKDVHQLDELLAEKFTFRGPLYEFDSKLEYIRSFLINPPIDFQYQIIHISESDNRVSIFYEFEKQGISVPMAQLFETENGKITDILLVFDSAPFK